MTRAFGFLIWSVLAVAIGAALAVAATSPLLAWREPVYIVAGLAGVVALALLVLQPQLISGHLPGARNRAGRRLHALSGAALTTAVVVHVVGLWLTSPPDVIDALLFRSPTPFSAWGVIAMWAVFGSAGLAALKRRLRTAPAKWRLWHVVLALVIVPCTVVHALLIEGTMGTTSKAVLCALALAATAWVLISQRVRFLPRR